MWNGRSIFIYGNHIIIYSTKYGKLEPPLPIFRGVLFFEIEWYLVTQTWLKPKSVIDLFTLLFYWISCITVLIFVCTVYIAGTIEFYSYSWRNVYRLLRVIIILIFISILFLDLSINRLYHGFYPTVVEIQIVTSYWALYGALRLLPLETLVVFEACRRISKPGSRAGRETGGASRTLVQVPLTGQALS